MKNNIANLLNNLRNARIVSTYKVVYAPEKSRNPHLPIQSYNIIGHPRNQAWRSNAGHRLFTARMAGNHQSFASFRAERVLSVNWSGFAIVSAAQLAKTVTVPVFPNLQVAK